MSTVREKLSAMARKQARIEQTKDAFKSKFEQKGVKIEDTIPFSEYPDKIDEIPPWTPNPTWWNIEEILRNDVQEGYENAGKAIYLLPDSEVSTSLSNASAYKTSDGAFYGTATASHTWDTSKDLQCDEGYKTRYVIAYFSSVEISTHLKLTNSLYIIMQDLTLRSCYYFFANLPLLFGVKTKNVTIPATTTNLSGMFRNCPSLQSVPELDTRNGIDFAYMFSESISLQSIPQLDTSNGTIFQAMFYYCYGLQSIPQLDTSNGTNFYAMFQNCLSLQSIPQLDTSNGTNFHAMFQNCPSLQSIPQLDTSNGTNFHAMFQTSRTILYSGGLTGCSADISFSDATYLTHQSLLNILNGLATVDTAPTLTLGNANLAKLTDEEKAIATNKGWTLA